MTVSVKAAAPALTLEGASEVIVGAGVPALTIVKVWAADVPPPGVGLNTVTARLPALARSAVLIVASSSEGDTYVVARFAPSQRTIESVVKPLPQTTRVSPLSPAFACVGERAAVVGAGLVVPVAPRSTRVKLSNEYVFSV